MSVLKSALVALALSAASPVRAQPLGTLEAAVAAGKSVVLPLHVRSGFAFLRGEVNGTAGDFMFDTGTPFALFLNRDFLHLPAGRKVARGSASSGQKITVFDEGCVQSASLEPGYRPASLCDMRSGDLGFVQKALDPRLLGFVGVALFKNAPVTFDLPRRRLVIGAYPTAGAQATPLTVVRFAADQPLPRFSLSAGGVSLEGRMDTGDPGHITLTRADADRLLAAGLLAERKGERGAPNRLVLARLQYDGVDLDSSRLPVVVGAAQSEVMLGFLFFARHPATFDFQRHTVTLY